MHQDKSHPQKEWISIHTSYHRRAQSCQPPRLVCRLIVIKTIAKQMKYGK